MRLSRRQLLIGSAATLAAGRSLIARAHDPSGHAHHGAAAPAVDEHAAHRQMLEKPTWTTSEREYTIPALMLRDSDGAPTRLQDLLGPDRAVMLNFIYTSCTTICPVMTATFLQVQRSLAAAATRPTFVSISVDPEFDTPQVLKSYAARTGAQWRLLTGSRPEVQQALQSFDAWRGNKANHAPVVLMKASGSRRWTRVDGMAPANQLTEIWTGLRA